MCLGEDTSSLAFHGRHLEGRDALRNKLVLHRGWHGLDTSYKNRPQENTRHAYLDSVKAGARFAECDVWVTKDGTLVLNHNSTFAVAAAQPDDRLAMLPISSLDWDELSELQLLDGSTPVRLDTVLKDLCGTEMRLVIELKTFAAASQLGAFFASRPDLMSSVAWVMIFSLMTLEHCSEGGGRQAGCRSVWLLDNPREAYPQEELEEGETIWDYAAESFSVFLDRMGSKQTFQHLQCGVYLQYNPCALPVHIQAARAEMSSLVPNAAPFIGAWSDAHLDASFDRVGVLSQWLDVFDVINTDLPRDFWLMTDMTDVESETSAEDCKERQRSLSSQSTSCSMDWSSTEEELSPQLDFPIAYVAAVA